MISKYFPQFPINFDYVPIIHLLTKFTRPLTIQVPADHSLLNANQRCNTSPLELLTFCLMSISTIIVTIIRIIRRTMKATATTLITFLFICTIAVQFNAQTLPQHHQLTLKFSHRQPLPLWSFHRVFLVVSCKVNLCLFPFFPILRLNFFFVQFAPLVLIGC